ncbi:DUF4062 domain-containing protein [Paenibacillus sp. YIM B09110]|uniref:DUF4062 domain-containing protein n=1 Tax=Paenibacillus sp. YIM B09110 TaxID=3126102 RepID=UPI00301E32A8
MIPNIFISSTILDLHHLRDAVRDSIQELEYNPVMSEYGDIGYLPNISAEDACYQTLKDCQLAIIIIAKRYGSLSQNGYSVTHNEFRTAKQSNKPVVCLVEKEVLSYKQVFDLNYSSSILNFPGMDNPEKSFEFLDEFIKSPVNNGFLEFSNVADVRRNLKRQMAHIFGDFLRNHYDSIKVEIHDILSEVKTLRYELLKGQKSNYEPMLKTYRFLLKERNSELKELLVKLASDIDNAVPYIVASTSFKDFLDKLGVELVVEVDDFFAEHLKRNKQYDYMTSFTPDNYEDLYLDDEKKKLNYYQYIIGQQNLLINQNTYMYFDKRFFQLLEVIKSK